VPLGVRQKMGFRQDGAPALYIRQWLNATCPRKWIGSWGSRMVSSVVESNSDVGRLKEHVYALSPKTINALMTVPQAAVAAVGANMFRRVLENVVRRTALYLEMDGGRYCNLLHLTVKCILRTERHRMHVVKHFWFFEKDSVLCSSFLSFCIYVDFFWSFYLMYHSGHWQFCLLDLNIFSVSMWLIVQEGFSVFSGHGDLRFIFWIIFILFYFYFTKIIINTEDSCDVRVSFVRNVE
jgi:hypothetical protein